jgi:hypothetical protein
MAKFLVECFDERGESLEAHCTYRAGDPHNRFGVEVMSPVGLRGQFDIDVPMGKEIGTAISERIQAEGIHARN